MQYLKHSSLELTSRELEVDLKFASRYAFSTVACLKFGIRPDADRQVPFLSFNARLKVNQQTHRKNDELKQGTESDILCFNPD